MKKKILLFSLPVVVIGGAIIVYSTSGTKINNGLSDRSKEFVKSKSKDSSSNWGLVSFGEDKNDTRGMTFSVDGCFTFQMIYRVTNQRIEGKCEGYYSFNDPKGSITTYLRSDISSPSTDAIEGVSFRRLSKNVYKERKQMINGKEFLIFTKIDSGYEANVFYSHHNNPFVFNLVLGDPTRGDVDLEKMLATLAFLN